MKMGLLYREKCILFFKLLFINWDLIIPVLFPPPSFQTTFQKRGKIFPDRYFDFRLWYSTYWRYNIEKDKFLRPADLCVGSRGTKRVNIFPVNFHISSRCKYSACIQFSPFFNYYAINKLFVWYVYII